MSRPLPPAVQKLIDAFGQDLPKRCAALAEALPQSPDTEALTEFGGAVHKLAGSSGSYGFRAVSEALRQLDAHIQDVLKDGASWDAQRAGGYLQAAQKAALEATAQP
ncbi:MAG: Hpt domain-containing protein [Oceanococcaceae bacterium]